MATVPPTPVPEIGAWLDCMPDAVLAVDRDGRIRHANLQAEEIFGYARAELVGQPVEVLLPEALREAHAGHRRRYFEDPVVRPMGIGLDLTARRKDGSAFPVEISLAPLPGGSVLASIRDNTYRMRMEHELREAQTRLEVRVQEERTAELAKANEALSRSNQEIQALISASPAAIVACDREGRMTLWSREAERIFGWSEGDVLGQACPAFPAELMDDLRAATARGETIRRPRVEGRAKDGSPVTVALGLAPKRGSAGEVLGSVAVIADVTERARLQREIEESRRFVERIAETVPGILYVLDIARRQILYANPPAARLLGHDPEKARALDPGLLTRLLHPEDQARMLEWIERLAGAADEEIIYAEYRLRAADGEWRWFRDRSTVFLRGPSRDVIQVLGVAHDITAQRRLEDALRESEQRFALFMKHLPAAVFIKDAEGRLVFLNDAGVRHLSLLGFTEWSGKTAEDHWPAQLAQAIRRDDEAVLKSGEPVLAEYTDPRQGGRDFQVIKFPVFDAAGKPILLGGIAIEVTEQKRAQEALRLSHEQLHALAARLLAAEEELARRVARELHDDLNQRLAALAVELGIHARGLPEAAGETRQRLLSAQQSVADVSDNVRQLARQLHPAILEHLGLDAALRTYCEEFSKKEGIRVEFRRRNVPAFVPPDVASCLYRIVQESLRNVARHAQAREAAVALSGVRDGILLRVSDSGIGFQPEEVRAKRGLGLVSMEERVRLVNGSLSIRSRPGDGTIVEVVIPVLEKSE